MKIVRLVLVVHLALSMSIPSADDSYISWPSWDNFVAAGCGSFSAMVFLTGFILACEQKMYGDSCSGVMMWQAAAGLYPPYAICVIAAVCFSIDSPAGLLYKLLCVDTVSGGSSVLGGYVGSILLLLIIFQPSIKLIEDVLHTRSSRLSMLLVMWLGSFVEAANSAGIRMTPMPVISLACAIHSCEFLAGVVLALMWLEGQLEPFQHPLPSSVYKRCLGCLIALLFSMYMVLGLCRTSLAASGFLWPLHASLLCCVLGSSDIVNSMVRLPHAATLAALAFPAMASIDFTVSLASRVSNLVPVQSDLCHTVLSQAVLILCLTLIALAMNCLVVCPVQHLAAQFPPLWTSIKTRLESVGSRSSGSVLASTFYLRVQQHVAFYGIFLGFNAAFTALILHWFLGRQVSDEATGIVAVLRQCPPASHLVGILKWAIAAPATALSVLGQLVYNPFVKEEEPSLAALLADGTLAGCKLRFRYVTRGMSVNLIRANVEEAVRVLQAVEGLPSTAWEVEVVTDRFIGISEPGQAKEIVVPLSYEIVDEFGSETKYKARALNYAIEHGGADESDWIIHLDEETRFDTRSVVLIVKHCVEEARRVAADQSSPPAVGQGVILYGTGRCGPVVNWITTLADSIRVADDFGKFRLQFAALERPLIGMHGSYVVACHSVEKAVGFRYGMKGSITEDAHWSLMATAHHDVHFKWIDAYMYEQSPFDMQDFVKQRRRWFAGIWLVCQDARIPLKWRVAVATMNCWWLLSLPLGLVGTLAAFEPDELTTSYMVAVGLAGSFSTWNYIAGFIMTYRMHDGVARYIVLLSLQLILQPFFMFLEYAGVVLAVVKPAFAEFHVVQKEAMRPSLA